MSHWREIGPKVEILWDSFICLSFCLSFTTHTHKNMHTHTKYCPYQRKCSAEVFFGWFSVNHKL